jgi:RHS repeat-associated protein
LSHSPDVMLRGGVVYRYVHDVLGSVRLVVNTATGQVVQRLDYDSWGVITADSSPGFQPFAFAGGLYDGDTRLARFGARDYDATTGRWTAKDPIGFESGTTNLYEFVSNEPISHIDPSGLDVLPTAGDRDLWNGVSRLRSTKTGKDLYDYLRKSRPERIPLSSMKAEFVSGDMQGWINGRTRFIRRGKRIFAACYAVTDPGDIGTEADPALNIAEELAHVRALIDFPRMGDALRDKYVDHIVYRVAQELGVSYAPSHIHSAP